MVLAKLDYDRLLTNGMQRHVCLGFRPQQQRRWFPLNRITSKAGGKYFNYGYVYRETRLIT
ncbi:hypothetical protein Hanom_Chr01g00029501 [Helianthus anomalus]